MGLNFSVVLILLLNTTLPSLRFPALYPRFASYCEYRISRLLVRSKWQGVSRVKNKQTNKQTNKKKAGKHGQKTVGNLVGYTSNVGTYYVVLHEVLLQVPFIADFGCPRRKAVSCVEDL